MLLECLVVARDPQVQRTLSPLLSSMNIQLRTSNTLEDATLKMRDVKYDSVIVDCVDLPGAGDLLRNMRKNSANAKTIALALTPVKPGREWVTLPAHFLLEKPISMEMAARTIRLMRDLMTQEKRRYFRYAVMFTASVTQNAGRIDVQGTNVSAGGMAVKTTKPLQVGSKCGVEFMLPGMKSTAIATGEVVWANAQNQAGIRFTSVPPRVQEQLEDWMTNSHLQEVAPA
jgi:DNA-binding response OmpR family regulator